MSESGGSDQARKELETIQEDAERLIDTVHAPRCCVTHLNWAQAQSLRTKCKIARRVRALKSKGKQVRTCYVRRMSFHSVFQLNGVLQRAWGEAAKGQNEQARTDTDKALSDAETEEKEIKVLLSMVRTVPHDGATGVERPC